MKPIFIITPVPFTSDIRYRVYRRLTVGALDVYECDVEGLSGEEIVIYSHFPDEPGGKRMATMYVLVDEVAAAIAEGRATIDQWRRRK